MDVRFVENEKGAVRDALEAVLTDADEARVAVAYARASALDELPGLERLAKGARSLRYLAGVDFQLTDLDALARLHAPPTAESRVFWLHPGSDGESRNFHPKVYIAQRGNEVKALVGSSNFTAGGLQRNVEANLLIRGSVDDPAVRQILEFHERFWTSPFSVPVSASVRGVYERLQRRRMEAELGLRREPRYEQARRQLELAVSEAIVSDGEPRGRLSWLMVTSPENYILCQQGRIWGDERKERISRIRTGDVLLFYIAKLHQLGMMALVTGPVFEESRPYWEDRLYPYRIHFMILAEPRSPVAFRPLVGELDLFRGTDPANWGQVLQRSQIKLDSGDARRIRQAILRAAGLEGAA